MYIIGRKNIPSSLQEASGIWTTEEQFIYKSQNIWPVQDVTSNLQLNYDFRSSNAFSGSTVYDSSGNARHGTITSNVYIMNGACYFNSSSGSYVTIPSTLGTLGEYSVNYWMKRMTGTTGVHLQIGQGNNLGCYFENYADTTLHTWFFDSVNSPQNIAWGSVLSVTEFTNVTLTGVVSSRIYTKYINGVYIGQDTLASSTVAPSNSGTYRFKSSTSTWGGAISEIQIFNKVLSASEIYRLYLNAKNKY